MIKVLIADDEHLICEWLQFCIEKNQDCQLIGIAHNGKDALKLFLEKEPDLVLTDIKMPVMDGLALLHEIRRHSVETQVVLLTAFSDFDLAREALRDGANEYLLKTEMENQLFQDLLERICQKCAAGKDADSAAVYTAQAHAMIRDLMLRHGVLEEGQLSILKQCGVKWRNNCLFAIAFWKRQLVTAKALPRQNEHIQVVAEFDYTPRIYILVANIPDTLSQSEQRRQQLQFAKDLREQSGCAVGISAVAAHMRDISHLIHQAAFALAQSFYTEESRLYCSGESYDAYKERISRWKNGFQALQHDFYKLPAFRQYEAVEALLKKTAQERIADVELVSRSCCQILEALHFTSGDGSVVSLVEKACQEIMSSIHMKDVRAIVLNCTAAYAAPKNVVQKPKSKAVILAVEYIRSNFEKPLSLEETATVVYLNAEYFSRIFKEEMGCTFIAYLTDLRLSRSVQLLENTAMRVQAVAQAVGYANVSHFSTVFKKNYGVSPYEYRRRSDQS